MTDKKIPRYLRLKDNHPTMIKLFKLYDLAEGLGIHLSFLGTATIVDDRDRDKSLPPLKLEDIENQEEDIGEWPPTFEFKVIYDNPEYLAEEKRQREERIQQAAEQAAARDAEVVLRKKKRAEEHRAEKERQERAQLANLKSKYERE